MTQFPIQFSKLPEPIKKAPRPETPTTDQVETSWLPLLYALAWYQGYTARGK